MPPAFHRPGIDLRQADAAACDFRFFVPSSPVHGNGPRTSVSISRRRSPRVELSERKTGVDAGSASERFGYSARQVRADGGQHRPRSARPKGGVPLGIVEVASIAR